MPTRDIQTIIEQWPYESGQINVRKIRGGNNRLKIQMRVDLGVLQMELDGRPDGQRPYNCESLLDYYQRLAKNYKQKNGTDLGFFLDTEECKAIRDEADQYYKRYLANFVLEDYEAVIRDTQRNLDALDFCGKFASDEADQLSMEQYRPYLVMMNVRCKSLIALENGAYRTALTHVENGLRMIKSFFDKFGVPKAFKMSGEVKVLKKLRKEVRQHLPVDPVRKLKRKLTRALKEERYEDAARFRDQLDTLLNEPNQ
jgi:hypothetical protein